MTCGRDRGEPAGVLDTAAPLLQDSVPRRWGVLEEERENWMDEELRKTRSSVEEEEEEVCPQILMLLGLMH